MKNIILCVLLIEAFFVGGCQNSGGESRNEEAIPKKLLIPLYGYPNNPSWNELIEMKRLHPKVEVVAIVNQSNGEFDVCDNNFIAGIEYLKNEGIAPIGYVRTDYTDKDITEVQENVTFWASCYKKYGLEGIFFDEVSRLNEDVAYYKTLAEYTHAKGLSFIVLNPGTNVEQGYFEENVASLIVTKETTYASGINATEFNEPTSSTQLGVLFYKSADADMPSKLCTYAKEHDFAYIYATGDGFDGNPWDSLSDYLEEIMTLIENGCS
jgi:hypothetical protein